MLNSSYAKNDREDDVGGYEPINTNNPSLINTLNKSKSQFQRRLCLKELPTFGKIEKAFQQIVAGKNFEVHDLEVLADGEKRLCYAVIFAPLFDQRPEIQSLKCVRLVYV